jgi:F-type H+-transporting ATPase subunit b
MELEHQAREDAEQLRANWQESLRRDKDAFLRELRRRAGHNACSAARRVLDEMADTALEQRMIDVWRARMAALDDERREALKAAARDTQHGFVVRSAFELKEERRAEISQLLHDMVADEAEVSFATDEEIVCGIELRAGSYKLAWSVADYLRGLEESVAELIDDAAHAEESP